MRDTLKKIVNAILSEPVDKRLHFEAGVIIAAFFVIAIGVPVVSAFELIHAILF